MAVLLAVNLTGLVLALAVGELAIRMLSRPTAAGRAFSGVLLLPRDWRATRASVARLLSARPASISYFVADTLLGWTVAPARMSRDGLYASSIEGARSGRPGTAFSRDSSVERVALVGDSFTFGLEVPYGASWGSKLESALGPGYTVMNFGVDGYGIDQAYLRYHRDVRPLRPTLVVFGFIDHDFERSLCVYTFLCYPHWGFPFAKPRFVRREDRLHLLDVPVPGAERILAAGSVEALPYLGFDAGYRRTEWVKHWFDWSYLARFVASRLRPNVPPRALAGGTSEEINIGLLRRFADEAVQDGARFVLVYFPTRGDFTRVGTARRTPVLEMLERSGLPFLDVSPCMFGMRVEDAFNPGRGHYSPAGNTRAMECILPAVRERLARRSGIRSG